MVCTVAAGDGRVRADDLAVLRVQRARQHDARPFRLDAQRHEHRLRGRRRAVVHAGVGHLHPEQHRDQRLKLEDRLQRPLAHLGLVRRVGGVELGPLQDLVDHRRHEVRVGAGAEEAVLLRGRVACRQRFEPRPHLLLGEPGRQVDRGAGAQRPAARR